MALTIPYDGVELRQVVMTTEAGMALNLPLVDGRYTIATGVAPWGLIVVKHNMVRVGLLNDPDRRLWLNPDHIVVFELMDEEGALG